jgi:Desulfoferrodoxin, N-terminal domain
MPNMLGKRYACADCGATVLVTKPGDGTVTCHGAPMEQHQAKPLPSSD